mgnify:CR=1 FL=1
MAKKEFQAESKKLMDMMINSIYTNKEIFLRELISNASDAIDKLYYKSLTDTSVGMNKSDFRILITRDKENRILTVEDNGIGIPLNEAPVWQRMLVMAAGAVMNFVLGFVIVACLYANAQAFRVPVLAGFIEGCPYESAEGLQQGDRFYSIDGHRIYQYYDVSDFISKGDGSYDIVVIRDGKKVKLEDFKLVPLEYEGYENKMYGFLFGVEEATIGAKIENTWNTCMEFVRMVWMGLSELVSGNVGVKDMAGPVGIVDMMAQTGEQAESVSDALSSIFYFGAFIAVNLAVMNMLPIPALDGGRVFLLIITCIIEVITRKKLNPKYEGYIHAAGMVLLLALMVYVMFNDIIRIVTG